MASFHFHICVHILLKTNGLHIKKPRFRKPRLQVQRGVKINKFFLSEKTT